MHFSTVDDAKEFVVSRIVAEAQREGTLLSEIERKMLYFPATSSDPKWPKVNDEFDREYDQDEYENKIANLINAARKRARVDGSSESQAWADAKRRLNEGDHYLSIMLSGVTARTPSGADVRPPYDQLKLLGAAIAVICVVLCFVLVGSYVSDLLGIHWTGEQTGFYLWATAASGGALYLLVSVIFGRERTDRAVNRMLGKLLPRFFKK